MKMKFGFFYSMLIVQELHLRIPSKPDYRYSSEFIATLMAHVTAMIFQVIALFYSTLDTSHFFDNKLEVRHFGIHTFRERPKFGGTHNNRYITYSICSVCVQKYTLLYRYCCRSWPTDRWLYFVYSGRDLAAPKWFQGVIRATQLFENWRGFQVHNFMVVNLTNELL